MRCQHSFLGCNKCGCWWRSLGRSTWKFSAVSTNFAVNDSEKWSLLIKRKAIGQPVWIVRKTAVELSIRERIWAYVLGLGLAWGRESAWGYTSLHARHVHMPQYLHKLLHCNLASERINDFLLKVPQLQSGKLPVWMPFCWLSSSSPL